MKDGDGETKKAAARTGAAAGAGAGASKEAFKMNKWYPVFMWKWNLESKFCSICRNSIDEKCLECQSNSKFDDCPLTWGVCGHVFHHHCIENWLKSRNTCPLDNGPWSFAKVGK